MKVANLKAALAERGLDTTGKKDELIQRLKQANDAETGINTIPMQRCSIMCRFYV